MRKLGSARAGEASGKAACALCGTPCRAPFQAPPAELAPDLDLRPGEPTRSTLAKWIMTCRGCGASAPDLAVLALATRAVVEAEEYRRLAGVAPELAFLRWATLCEAAGDRVAAAEAVLEAAWVVDDAGEDADREDGAGRHAAGRAAKLRTRAAALWGEPATIQDGLRLVDVLRRGGEFGAAQVQAEGLLARPGLDETDAAVLHYQLGLIAAGDSGRHLMSSALRPPARTPHVSHGRPPPLLRGFWQRLTGG